MLSETLLKLGFSPSEIKVYLCLIEMGPSYANKISAKAKVNRTNVYEALDRLIAKGVISFIIKNKVKWYEANSPSTLVNLIKEKEDEIEETKKKIMQDFNEINELASKDKKQLEGSIFIGKNGLRMLFENIIKEEKSISLIGSEMQFKDIFKEYFEQWHKRRSENKIKQRTILPLKLKGKVQKRGLLEYKFIEDKFTNPTTTIIYGDNCLFIEWSKELIAIKINNKEITKSHLNYFNQIWKLAKK